MSQKHIKNGFRVLVFLAITQAFSACDITTFLFIKKDYAQSLPKENRKVSIEIPEMYEMMLVATSLTDTSFFKSILIDTTTAYYQDVKMAFSDYKNLPLVKRLNKVYKKDFWQKNAMATISFQSTYYKFENGKLVDENRYKITDLVKIAPTPLPIFGRNKAAIEDFYEKTHFADFYKTHKSYYDTLITQTAEGSGIENIWQWLEVNFPIRKESYRVITSPLLGSIHSTVPLFTKDKKISEMLCFVSPITPNSKMVPVEQKFGNQKMFMTEINENYAHVPKQFLPELKKLMNKNMLKWNNGNAVSKYYKGYENTFNENFTHAVMGCYGYDRYEPAVFEKKWAEYQNFMVKKRGFPSFKAFSDELLRLYKNRAKGQTVNDLFAPMVAWVKQNADN
jgi:hypothetical protein